MSGEIIRRIEELEKNFHKDLPQHAYEFFKKTTPIKSGNARNRTELKNNEIHGSYPYAERLDNGYSKQAPQGMTAPTLEEISKFVKNTRKA